MENLKRIDPKVEEEMDLVTKDVVIEEVKEKSSLEKEISRTLRAISTLEQLQKQSVNSDLADVTLSYETLEFLLGSLRTSKLRLEHLIIFSNNTNTQSSKIENVLNQVISALPKVEIK